MTRRPRTLAAGVTAYSPLYVVAILGARTSQQALLDELAGLHRRGARLLVVGAGLEAVTAGLSRRGLSVLDISARAGWLVRALGSTIGQGDGTEVARLVTSLGAFDAVCVAPPPRETGRPAGAAPDVPFDAAALAALAARAAAADHLRLVGWPGAHADPKAGSPVGSPAGSQAGSQADSQVGSLAAGTADVVRTEPGTIFAAAGTRLWRAIPPSADLELLSRMVEIPSVSGDERELAEFLVGWCTARGVAASIDPAGNLVASRGSGPRRLLLLGHLDTVPYRWPVRWNGETITGRGCVDAKASLAAFLQILAELDVPPDVELRVVGAVEEELTSAGAFAARDSYPADAVIVGEPSGADGLTIGYYGICKVRLTVADATAHTAGRGVRTAADQMVDLIGVLRTEVGRLNPDALVAVLDLAAANDGAVQAGHAVADIRLPPGTDTGQLLAAVARVTGQPAGEQVQRCTPGVSTPRSSPLVRAFSQAFRAAGVTPRYLFKKGSSDMNTLATTWHGVPMVAYGPGDSRLDHTPRECLHAAEYQRATAVLADAIRRWAAGPPESSAAGRTAAAAATSPGGTVTARVRSSS